MVVLNTWQQHCIARLVVQKLFGTMTGKRLATFDFAFKAYTNNTRKAPVIRICSNLLEEGFQLAINDSKVENAQIAQDLQLYGQLGDGQIRGAGTVWCRSRLDSHRMAASFLIGLVRSGLPHAPARLGVRCTFGGRCRSGEGGRPESLARRRRR